MPQSFLDSLPTAVSNSVVFYIDADDISGVNNGDVIPNVTEFVSSVSSSACHATYASTSSISRPAFDFDGVDATSNSIVFADTSITALDSALKSTEFTIYSVAIPRSSGSSDDNIFEYNSKIRLKQSADEVGTTLPANDLLFRGSGQNNLSSMAISFTNTTPEYTGGTLAEMLLNGSLVKNRSSDYTPNTNNTNIYIGTNRGLAGAFDGLLFKFLIFNRPLTPQEMVELDTAVVANLGLPNRLQGINKILALDGNSIPNGVGSSNGANEDGFAYVTKNALSLPDGSWHNMCRSGSNIQEANSSFVHRLGWMEDYYEKPIVVAANYWVNEDATGSDYAEEARNYMALAPLNTHFIWGTPPHGGWDATKEARRQQDIADIIADSGDAVLIWDLHSNPQIGVDGSFTANPSLFSDSVSHLTAAGQLEGSQDFVPVYNSYTPPAYIGLPVVGTGMSFIIQEDTIVGTRINNSITGVPSPIVWTGGGTASAYAITDVDYSVDSSGYITIANVNSTPETVNPSVTVTNEAGTSQPQQVTIEVTDVDTSIVPVIPAVSLNLEFDSQFNVAGGVLTTLATENVSGSVSITGTDANRFTLNQTGNTVVILLVDPLPVGSYSAFLSGVNNDPDGTFSQTTISQLSVNVVVNTDVEKSFDFDITGGIKQLKSLKNDLIVGEWGMPIRINIGEKLNNPQIEFSCVSDDTQNFTVTSVQGLSIGELDITDTNGYLYKEGEYLFYVIEQSRFSTTGEWDFVVKDNLSGGGVNIYPKKSFTVLDC